MSLITYSAIFDGTDLTTISGLTVLSTNPYAPAGRKLTIGDIARTNKSTTTAAFYKSRPVTVRIGITRATRDLMETSLDSLMTLLQGVEKDLVLKQSTGNRKYTCTYSSSTLRVEGGSYIEMDLVFETSDHFGYDQNDTLLLQVTNFTSAQRTNQITVGGSALWQVPKITITISALTGGTTKFVSVGNDATGQTCTVTKTWLAGDVLVIDALAQTVKVNGAEVAFTGAIPEWSPGVGYLTYSDSLTTRTFSNTTTYKRRYV